jgi:hypothetical protein
MLSGPIGFCVVTTVGVDGGRHIQHFDGLCSHIEVTFKTLYLAAVHFDSLVFAASPCSVEAR